MNHVGLDSARGRQRRVPAARRRTKLAALKDTARSTRPGQLTIRTLLDLQSSAGNRAVASLLAGPMPAQPARRSPARQQLVQRDQRAGWSGADTRGSAGGWNLATRTIGTIRRVPLDGLSVGNTAIEFVGKESDKTTESGAHRAVVLLPSSVKPGQRVDVLLHFHGFSHRASDPYAGWRQHSRSGTVRDVDLDRIEAQLQASGKTSMIAVLPQGVGGSRFGGLRPDSYLPQIFERLAAAHEPPGTTSGKPLTQGRLVLSGHSGGGDRIAGMLNRPGGRQAAEIVLFEAIHKGGLTTVLGWATRHLDRVASGLETTVDAAGRARIVESCPTLVAYCSVRDPKVPGSGLYVATYTKLKQGLDRWFSANGSRLGDSLEQVRARFRVEFLHGLSHETVVRGVGDDPTAGPLADAIRALDSPTAPSRLGRSGSSTWVPPNRQPRVGSAAPITPAPATAPLDTASRVTAGPPSSLTPARILTIAATHGQGPFQLVAAMGRIVHGGDGYRILADVLVSGGLRDSTDLTDELFAVAHSELGGRRIPADRDDLKKDWLELRRRYARPAIAEARPALGASPSPGQSTGPASGRTGGATAPAPAPGQTAPGQPLPLDVGSVDPATVRPAKAATGAPALTEAERKAAVAAAISQAKTAGTASSRKDMEVVLDNHGQTYEGWFGDIIPNATFLDVPISPSGGTTSGVHRELAARLALAEAHLSRQFPGLSKAQIAGKMGIYQIAGVRPPKSSTGGSQPSAHCFGLAIDINHPTNPFVGNMKPKRKKKMTEEEKRKYQDYLTHRSPRVIERAMLLLHHEHFDVESRISVKGPGRAAQLWEIHHRASETLAEYLRLADDLQGQKLSNLVSRLNASGKDGRDLATWRTLIGEDRTLLVHWDFMHHKAPQLGGYLDLGKELVVALIDVAGLLWGGEYAGAKDMMHFDWRGGTIKSRSTTPKKKS
jgi:hypothetical protein